MFTASGVLALLPSLATRRPVFHSEADLQHALAWEVQVARPELRVRLETRPVPGVHLDLLFTDTTDGDSLAVELKYLTDRWEGEVEGEKFALLRQGAQDIRGYDCVKDIGRVERVVADGYARSGLVLVISNDPSYWRAPSHGRATNAAAFRLHDGLVLSGSRAWGPNTGAGTMAGGRTAPVDLRGTYSLAWQDYAKLPGPRGVFRYLAVSVPPESPRV